MIIGEYRLAQMFEFNIIVPNKVHIGWHFSSNKYAYRDAYSALKSGLALPIANCAIGEMVSNLAKGKTLRQFGETLLPPPVELFSRPLIYNCPSISQ